MKAYILIDNLHSYLDFGLLLESYAISSINENFEEIDVNGRNGKLTIFNGTYPDRIASFVFDMSINKNESLEEFSSRVELVEDWIDSSIGKDLILFNDTSKKLLVKRVIKNINSSDPLSTSITLDFICEPFKYEVGETYKTLMKSTNLNYNGNAPGECNIKIYGNGNIQLTINNETVQINNVNEYVELDSKLLLCLNKDKTSKTRDMIGDFLLLSKGKNHISWEGNVSRIEILPRTAYK